ncbi:MAG: S1C family serine protease [bacterium]
MRFGLCLLPWMFICGLVNPAAGSDEQAMSGYLGVVAEEMSPAMLAALNIEQGVLVADVVKNGPGAKAGLKIGDVILKIDGEMIGGVMGLRQMVRSRPGQKVAVVFLRQLKEQKVMVELGSRRTRGLRQLELRSLPIEVWRSLRQVWRKVEPQLRTGNDIYQESLDSLQKQIEELRFELLEMQRRLKELRR